MKARNTLIGMLIVVIAVLIPATASAQRDIRGGTAGASQSSYVRPDDRAGVRGAGATVSGVVVVRPDDRAGIRGPGAPTTPAVLVRTSDDFDWQDAFVGGLTGLGIALLLAGLLFFAASRRTRTRIA